VVLWFVKFTDFTWTIDATYVSEKLLSMYKTHSVKIWKFAAVVKVTFKKRLVSLYEITLKVMTVIININNTKKKWAKNID
jgi:hypothetical protein